MKGFHDFETAFIISLMLFHSKAGHVPCVLSTSGKNWNITSSEGGGMTPYEMEVEARMTVLTSITTASTKTGGYHPDFVYYADS
jgi:hypothetical protein